MSSNNIVYIIIITIIIIFLIIIYYPSDTKTRRRAYENYNNSNGTNDKFAKNAKKELNNIKHKTALDEFLKTRIEHLNENNQIITPNIIDGYTDTLKKLVHDPPDIHNTHNTPTREFITNAIENVTITLNNNRAHLNNNHTNLNNNRTNLNNNVRFPQMNGFQQMGGFQHFDAFQQIDGFLPMDDLLYVEDFLDLADTYLPIAKHNTIEARKMEAKQISNKKEDQIEYYLDSSKQVTNDPQNSHDVHVNKDIKYTYDKIEKDKLPFDIVKKEIVDTINHKFNNKEIDQKTHDSALMTLDQICKYNRNVNVLDNGTEKDVLCRVWGRTHSNGNEKNSDLMQLAVINALNDSVENNSVVCANGVTSRLLESPVLLDKDKDVGKVLTFDMIKNTILDKASIIVKNEIDHAKSSTDDTMKQIGKYYDGSDFNGDKKIIEKFEKNIKDKLDTMLGNEAKEHNLDFPSVENLRTQLHSSL